LRSRRHDTPSSLLNIRRPSSVASPLPRHCWCLADRVLSVQYRSKSLLWPDIGLSSGPPVPSLIPPPAPTSGREPFLQLLPRRFPQPSQSSPWTRLPRRELSGSSRFSFDLAPLRCVYVG